MNSAMQNRLQNRSGMKSELFQELEDQCYLVLKLEDEIQTFTIVEGPKVNLTVCFSHSVTGERFDVDGERMKNHREDKFVTAVVDLRAVLFSSGHPWPSQILKHAPSKNKFS
jgi:hypothetical protein